VGGLRHSKIIHSPFMGFMVNLPPHAKSTMETEKGFQFLRLIQLLMVTSVLSQGCFRVIGDPPLLPSAVFRLKIGAGINCEPCPQRWRKWITPDRSASSMGLMTAFLRAFFYRLQLPVRIQFANSRQTRLDAGNRKRATSSHRRTGYTGACSFA